MYRMVYGSSACDFLSALPPSPPTFIIRPNTLTESLINHKAVGRRAPLVLGIFGYIPQTYTIKHLQKTSGEPANGSPIQYIQNH